MVGNRFAALAGCSSITVLDAKSTTGKEQAYLIWFSLGLMLIVLAVVFILFARFVIKYRYTKEKENHLPKDVKGDLKLELTWTILPIILLIVLAVPTIQITYNQSPKTSADAKTGLDIHVAAEQFKWTFTQPNGKTEENKLVLPEGETVTLHLSSKDVIHSFWVPELAGKIDTTPGKQVTYEIKNPKKGTYKGKCAEYCGIQHANMVFEVQVVSQKAYEKYLDEMKKPSGKSQ